MGSKLQVAQDYTMSLNALGAKSDHSHEGEPLQSLVCPNCTVKYPNIHELLTHQAAERHFTCDQCPLCFWSEIGLRDHKRKVRSRLLPSPFQVSVTQSLPGRIIDLTWTSNALDVTLTLNALVGFGSIWRVGDARRSTLVI